MIEIRELRQRLDDDPVSRNVPGEKFPKVVIVKDHARISGGRPPSSFKKLNGDIAGYPAVTLIHMSS